jgi:hypothetical protein
MTLAQARRWRALRRVGLALGWQGIAGLVLLAAALGWEGYGRRSTPASPPLSSRIIAAGEGTDAMAPVVLRQVLVPAADAHQAVLKLFEAAAAQQLSLDSGQYRWVPGEGAYAAYAITLPLQGSYGQIRAFLAQSLRAQPSLALDALEFRRDDISKDVVAVRARFSLFVEQP